MIIISYLKHMIVGNVWPTNHISYLFVFFIAFFANVKG